MPKTKDTPAGDERELEHAIVKEILKLRADWKFGYRPDGSTNACMKAIERLEKLKRRGRLTTDD